MNFHINKIILWLKNGRIRKLEFEPNKVNVITGDSSTGKSEILHIIDYCFFSSSSQISESVVNENISWYGIQFNINGKEFTISRKSLKSGQVSEDYYFSSIGKIPKEVVANNTAASIKPIIETEFSIDSDVAIPYGSKTITLGSKVSLRYFFMFNTISVNIIENDSGVFFDKQNEARYRDALPRIFDLAVGIETVENVLKKEKKAELKAKLVKLEKKTEAVSNKSNLFESEQEVLVKEAKEYSIIDPNLDFEASLSAINIVISNLSSTENTEPVRQSVESEIFLHERKIRNLKQFTVEYTEYKKNQRDTTDSLKPIEHLLKKDADIIKTSVFDEIFYSLSAELGQIRDATKSSTPISRQVNDEIKAIELKLASLKRKLSIQPGHIDSFERDASKYIFLGESKAKLDLYSTSNNSNLEGLDRQIEDLGTEIGHIDIEDTAQKKQLTISVIEEIVSDFITSTGSALENYSDYLPMFDYKNKALLLRRAKEAHIENVGSSSNHMFLHLFFTLSMHEIAFKNSSPFVAPYIVIDQMSRPYWGGGDINKSELETSDISKITKAFELLNTFIENRQRNSGNFQMIVFEHVPTSVFENFEKCHLVEEFTDGNALIPLDMLDS
jgi:hypothetical protein